MSRLLIVSKNKIKKNILALSIIFLSSVNLFADENVKPIAYYPSAEGDYQQFQTTGETKILGRVAVGDPTGIGLTTSNNKLWVREGGVEVVGVTKTDGGLVVKNARGVDASSQVGEMWVDPT